MRISVSRVLCGADSGNNHKAYHRKCRRHRWLMALADRRTSRCRFSPCRRRAVCRNFGRRDSPAGTGRACGKSGRRNRRCGILRFRRWDPSRRQGGDESESMVRPMAAAPSPSAMVVTTTVCRPEARKSCITVSELRPQRGSTTSMPCGASCCSRYLRTSCRKMSPKMKCVTPCALKCATACDIAV